MISEDTGRTRKDKLFVKNIVRRIQAPEVKETQLREIFEAYGKVLECTIPRAHDPTMNRLYGFVEFTNELDATVAQRSTDGKVLYGMQLSVRYSIDPDKRQGFKSFWQDKPRSRSRSPVTYSLSNELKAQKDKLALENRAAIDKNQRLTGSISSLQDKNTQIAAENDALRKQLEQFKGIRIFLPCGHPKTVKESEAAQLEKLFDEGFERLSLEERQNGALVLKLRARAVQILEKMHESFRCRTPVRIKFDTCGHWQETECWIRRNQAEGGKRVKCEAENGAGRLCCDVGIKY